MKEDEGAPSSRRQHSSGPIHAVHNRRGVAELLVTSIAASAGHTEDERVVGAYAWDGSASNVCLGEDDDAVGGIVGAIGVVGRAPEILQL